MSTIYKLQIAAAIKEFQNSAIIGIRETEPIFCINSNEHFNQYHAMDAYLKIYEGSILSSESLPLSDDDSRHNLLSQLRFTLNKYSD